MAVNEKESKENQTHWNFRDSMVEDLVEALEASAYEGRGFEGDLVKLYSELRKTMSEKYEETDFGPTAVSEPTTSIEEMSKEEFKEHKKNADGSAAFNNKRHNEADHKRKIGTSCMFHVNILADLKSCTGLIIVSTTNCG